MPNTADMFPGLPLPYCGLYVLSGLCGALCLLGFAVCVLLGLVHFIGGVCCPVDAEWYG